MTGKVLIPDRPQPVLVMNGGQRFVSFPPVAGAAAYLVGGDTELYQRIVTTNVVRLFYDVDPALVRPNPQFRVIALDSNIVRYMAESVVGAAMVSSCVSSGTSVVEQRTRHQGQFGAGGSHVGRRAACAMNSASRAGVESTT